jgi:hypothetical protein
MVARLSLLFAGLLVIPAAVMGQEQTAPAKPPPPGLAVPP